MILCFSISSPAKQKGNHRFGSRVDNGACGASVSRAWKLEVGTSASESLFLFTTHLMTFVRFDLFVPINYFLEGPRGVNFHVRRGCLKGTEKLREPWFSSVKEKFLNL